MAPAIATGVVVTDALPEAVVFESVTSEPPGLCSEMAGTGIGDTPAHDAVCAWNVCSVRSPVAEAILRSDMTCRHPHPPSVEERRNESR
jgi:hypothetical protein